MMEIKEVEKLPKFVYGSFNKRFIAFMLDILLIGSISSFVLNIYRLFGWYNSGTNFSLFNVTSLVLYLAYFSLLTKFTNGQTLGKMVMGLRVVSLTHEELTWSDVLTREVVGRYIQKKIIILYLLVFVTKRKETPADLFTDTVVISEEAYLDLKEYLKIERG